MFRAIRAFGSSSSPTAFVRLNVACEQNMRRWVRCARNVPPLAGTAPTL
jgi:hypothetical protein